MQDIPYWLRLVWASSAIVMMVLAINWGIFVVWPYMRTTRKAILDGLKFSHDLHRDLAPAINDLKAAIADGRAIISELREKELEKITSILERLSAEGRIEKTFDAIQKLPGKIDELQKLITKAGMKNL